ncbi:MAG TPA: protein kinase, partial [Gemmatimonadales bacterium]|nr:protein kinase [Gemmatimonadales bacterium]
TANLQHPHILPLHDSGEADGFLFYVMPYVEGESLRDRLNREKQLPVAEAVRVVSEVAGALDYAHRHNVIHRDIKPENILLHDGSALVADFGIALAASKAGGTRMTETGMSLGTPHYMSPEQAMGEREITARSDVYALGAVAYELLTGDPPFTGSTAQAIVARVVTEHPRPMAAQRHTIPPHVEAAVLTALEKLPADRFASAADFAAALASAGHTAPTVATRTHRRADAPTRRQAILRLLPWALALAAAAAAAWLALRPAPARPVSRFAIGLPADQGIVGARGNRVTIAPDGSRIVYVGPGEGTRRVWVRRRDELSATPVPGTDLPAHVFISPDGRRAGVITESQRILVVPLDGGPAVAITDSAVGLDGATWSEDGYIYFDGLTGGGTTGILRVPAAGGTWDTVTVVRREASETDHVWPEALPDGRGVLFTIARGGDMRTADIGVVPPDGGAHRVLFRGVTARYSPTGHLVYVTVDGTLLVVPFDLKRLEVTGEPVPLASGLNIRPFGAVDLALSAEGTLLYTTGGRGDDPREVVWVGLDGSVVPVDPGWVGDLRTLAVSPDGRRLAVSIFAEGEEQIWVKQLPDGPLSKITFDGPAAWRPSWSADGRDVLYVSLQGITPDAWSKRADGSAPAELLLDIAAPVQEAFRSRDGEWLVYRTTPRDIMGLSRAGDTVPLVATPFEERAPALSPDGRWLAYQSDEAGRYEVFVRPFPATSTAKWQVSNGGGTVPRWSPDGRVLYYRGTGNVVAVEVLPGPSFIAGGRRTLFGLGTFADEEGSWDIAPDGRRFAMIRDRGVADPVGLVVVEGLGQVLGGR